MKANKKRIVLSALSLVLVFCLLAGGTMAWFTDTEKVAGNFSAGILDIEVNPDPENGNFTTTKPMEFKNLRPMLLKNFDKELVEYDEATETFADVNNLENNGQDPKNYGDNLPIYFRPVRVENRGTLPIYIHLGMNATAGNDTEPVLYGDNKYEIDQGLYKDKTCENTLEDALKIFVYKKDGDTWTRLENINLNKETATTIPPISSALTKRLHTSSADTCRLRRATNTRASIITALWKSGLVRWIRVRTTMVTPVKIRNLLP